MPVINTLGALTYPKYSTLNLPSGDGYIFTGPGYGFYADDDSGRGTGIDIDNGGNLYLGTTILGANYWTGSQGYAAKFDSNANVVYSIPSFLGTTPTVTTDGNVYFTGISAFLSNGIPTYSAVNLRIDNGNTSIDECNYTGAMVNAYNFPDIYGIKADNSNNTFAMYGFGLQNTGQIYKNISNNTTSTRGQVVTNLGGTSQLIPISFCIDPNDNLYVMCTITNVGPTTNTYIVKMNSSLASMAWRIKLSIPFNAGYDIAADANYCYVTHSGGIIKINGSNGTIVDQKGNMANNAKITIGPDGNLYTFSTVISSITPNLNFNWITAFQLPNWGPSSPGGTIGIAANNTHVFGASTHRSKLFGFKVPIDGSIPGSNLNNIGVYTLSSYIIKYFQVSGSTTTTSVTASSTTDFSVTFGPYTFDVTTPDVDTLIPNYVYPAKLI